jgi:hypothetical protein
MTHHEHLRRAFVCFHLTLGIVVLVDSFVTALRAAGVAGNLAPNMHLLLLAGVETIAALLFLLPGMVSAGATALLVVFGIAIVAHATRGEWPSNLLVYAAGTAFVLVHGSAYRGDLSVPRSTS